MTTVCPTVSSETLPSCNLMSSTVKRRRAMRRRTREGATLLVRSELTVTVKTKIPVSQNVARGPARSHLDSEWASLSTFLSQPRTKWTARYRCIKLGILWTVRKSNTAPLSVHPEAEGASFQSFSQQFRTSSPVTTWGPIVRSLTACSQRSTSRPRAQSNSRIEFELFI